jgi:hypothetical protein
MGGSCCGMKPEACRLKARMVRDGNVAVVQQQSDVSHTTPTLFLFSFTGSEASPTYMLRWRGGARGS